MKLIFASGNKHKLQELQSKLPSHIQLVSMRDEGFSGEIEEPGKTLEENARIKAKFIFERFGENCLADDSGIEIEALNGEPGVYSARYAGENCSFLDNNLKVLKNLKGVHNRRARFRTVIHLFLEGKEYFFEGSIDGDITESIKGADGFGYDPIFRPRGKKETFAEMTLDEKNQISHRALAVEDLIQFLSTFE